MQFVTNQQNCRQIYRTDVFANLDSNVQNKDELLFKPVCQFHFSLRRLTRHSQLSNGIAWRQLRRSLPKPDKKRVSTVEIRLASLQYCLTDTAPLGVQQEQYKTRAKPWFCIA
jgi:hypothetical protein